MLHFYWFSWILWVLITFFMKKSVDRTFFAGWILVLIICSDTSIHFGGYSFFLSYFVLFLGLIYFHSIANSLYLLFASFTICLGYTAILFWEQITPIWMFLPRTVLIPIVIAILVTLLTKGLTERLAIGLIGMTLGELYHGYILTSYELSITIGNFSFFTVILTFVLLHTLLEFMQKGNIALYSYLKKHRESQQWQNEQANIGDFVKKRTLK